MTKFLAVVKREYLTRVRTKMFVVFTVLGPLMIVLFTVVPAFIASIKRERHAPRRHRPDRGREDVRARARFHHQER